MTEYCIEYKRDDMPENYTGKTFKWAHNEKEAVDYILQKRPEKDGTCVFKRGGTGKIISVKKLVQINIK
jgi:hypothetical protein